MLIAGNWKMHTDLAAAVKLASEVARAVEGTDERIDVAVCPPFVSLEAVAEIVQGTRVLLGAQNMHHEDEGAFTGEVAPAMLTSVGCDLVILGHSERRSLFGETDEVVGRKVRSAMRHGLIPIVCVGETLEERDRGDERRVVEHQVRASLAQLEIDDPESLVLAYEPVWAIGTGRTASPEQAQEMHAAIRSLLTELFDEVGPYVRILYGGSVKPGNAEELLKQQDVDGGLIGGASLKAEDFAAIVGAAPPA